MEAQSGFLSTYLSTNIGIIVHHVDTSNPGSSLPPVLCENTMLKLVLMLLESPTNLLIKLCGIPFVSFVVHAPRHSVSHMYAGNYTKRKGGEGELVVHAANPDALSIVDNTMTSPYLCNLLQLDTDIVYKLDTKYLSSHHNLMAGVFYITSPVVASHLALTINAFGCALSPFDPWLLLRGIKTLLVRLKK